MLGVHHDCSGVAHLALNERFSGLRSLLQPGNADSLLRPIICPVEITPHPIYCDSLNCVNTWDAQRKPKWELNYELPNLEPISRELSENYVE